MTVRQPSMVVEIDGIPYFLARTKDGAPEYHDRQVQTQEGDPTAPRRFRYRDWSRGMGDSRGVFPGAVESSSNAYLGATGRILPGPKIGVIATDHDQAVMSLVEVSAPANRVISLGGRYAREINPSTKSFTSQDFGAGRVVSGEAAVFRDMVAIPMGTTDQFWWRSEAGAYAVSSLTQDGTGDFRYADCFGLSPDGDLVRGRGATWSKCAASLFHGSAPDTGVLTLTANAANNATVVIGTKTYTFKTSLTNTDGFVLIGTDIAASMQNLANAITLGPGAGTTYALATTVHPTVTALAGTNGTTLLVTAKTAGGTAISTSETLASGSWGSTTLVRGNLNGNWTVEYAIGDETGNVTSVFNFERWDYVLKEEGLYTFDAEQSKETNVLPDLKTFRNTDNKRVFPWYNRLFLCTYAGLYRYIQNGGARTVGIEEAELNESILTDAYPTAGVAFGKWAYVAYWDGTSTYICLVRNAKEGDASFGAPFTVVSVIDSFSAKCNAMLLSSGGGTPTVYYGRGVDVGYFEVTRSGRIKNYRDSGNTVVTFPPNDLGSPMTTKYVRGVECVTRNASASRTIQWGLSWDGGGFSNLGTTITSSGFAQRFVTQGSNDSGLVPQLQVTMANNSTTTAPEVRDVILNFEERPNMVPGAVLLLRLRDQDAEGEVTTRLSAVEQLANLQAICEGPPINFTDPYGETWLAAFSQFQGDLSYWQKDQNPQNVVALQIRRLDYV